MWNMVPFKNSYLIIVFILRMFPARHNYQAQRFQKAGVNNTITVKTSSLPIHILAIRINLPGSGMESKLAIGLILDLPWAFKLAWILGVILGIS